MWEKSVEMHPELGVIDDDAYIHKILAARTVKEENAVLDDFLAERRKDEKKSEGKESEGKVATRD